LKKGLNKKNAGCKTGIFLLKIIRQKK